MNFYEADRHKITFLDPGISQFKLKRTEIVFVPSDAFGEKYFRWDKQFYPMPLLDSNFLKEIK